MQDWNTWRQQSRTPEGSASLLAYINDLQNYLGLNIGAKEDLLDFTEACIVLGNMIFNLGSRQVPISHQVLFGALAKVSQAPDNAMSLFLRLVFFVTTDHARASHWACKVPTLLDVLEKRPSQDTKRYVLLILANLDDESLFPAFVPLEKLIRDTTASPKDVGNAGPADNILLPAFQVFYRIAATRPVDVQVTEKAWLCFKQSASLLKDDMNEKSLEHAQAVLCPYISVVVQGTIQGQLKDVVYKDIDFDPELKCVMKRILQSGFLFPSLSLYLGMLVSYICDKKVVSMAHWLGSGTLASFIQRYGEALELDFTPSGDEGDFIHGHETPPLQPAIHMTEEEQEREAERLVVLLKRLNDNGIIKVDLQKLLESTEN